jgi:pyridoxal phosphate enzyme (YggS family)
VEDVRRRLDEVRARIAACGRDDGSVTIVAVTKGFGVEAVEAAAAVGLFDVGENQAQQLVAKAESGRVPAGVRWHFLGPVQRNKVGKLAPHVHLWQAVDRREAGESIARHRPAARVLVQVNVSGAANRPGCTWSDAPGLVEGLRGVGLDVQGLMGVASRGDAARDELGRLAGLRTELGLAELSMGMSDDLEVALEAGATIVRLGTALFGPRPTAGIDRA